MQAALVAFLLFFLPLVVIPIGISPFETPKVVLAEITISILLFIKFFKLRKKDFKHFLTYPQLLFIGILFILSLDTQLLFKPAGAFFGNVFRLQGQFLFWYLLLFAILSRSIKLDKIPAILYYLSFICLTLATLILGVNENNRAFGTLGEPNALAATILFLFPFTYFKSRMVVKTGVFLISLIIILLSGSRAGLIGFLLEMLFISFTQFVKLSVIKSSLICILLIFFSLFLPFFSYQGWFEIRTEVWQTAFKAGLESPLIGHGFGSIQAVIHQTAVSLNNNVQYQVVDSAHNFLLDFWIQGGLVGVVSVSLLIYLAFQHFIQHHKLLETTALLGLIVAMLFNPVSVVNLLAFWWLIGQGFDNQHRIS